MNDLTSSSTSPETQTAFVYSRKLQHLLKLQLQQLTAHPAIRWAQVVYLDSLTGLRQQVKTEWQPLSQELLAYLNSEEWLVDFPPVLTLERVSADRLNGEFYFCPLGYCQQQCQYLLIQLEEYSPALQQIIQQTATLLIQHLNLYSEMQQQRSQIQILEQIVQRVGHQLRHPLSLITLYAENLRRSLPEGQPQEQAAIIRDVSQDLNDNLTELIYCSRSGMLRITLQDLRSLVIESVQRFQAGITQKQIQVQYPDSSLILSLDRAQMKQVFDNLLSNAIHFSPQAGTIAFNWQIFHNEVLITIADQGPGLSEEDLQRLFNPFYSRRSGGTGLGLAIARKAVLDHQGNIWARNLPDQGAEFSMILPRESPFMSLPENVTW